jgi:glycosyltransferase involved in cell wall biosynthesis
MRLAFIADARSPIARNWINYFVTSEHGVHVISSYPCAADEWPGVQLHVVPIGLSRWVQLKPAVFNGAAAGGSRRVVRAGLLWLAQISKELQGHAIAPLDAARQGTQVRRLLKTIQPDLVHAMRIPYEGIMAAHAVTPQMRLLISVWGNDFTLHAAHYPLTRRGTRNTLARANALHTDCQRDLRLAAEWGFDPGTPAIVLPGAGGIQGDVFHPGEASLHWQQQLDIPSGAPVVINPRGLRQYVLNDVFFQAIPAVLRERPDTVFLCCAMQGSAEAENWINRLGIASNVRLLPAVPRAEMADIFRLAQISVSPSAHDGTPNTLLEAMASGCFPVAGDIESVREWIHDGSNGLLYPIHDTVALAHAIVRALGDADLRRDAGHINEHLIAERAEYGSVMARAEEFYRQLIAEPLNDQINGKPTVA